MVFQYTLMSICEFKTLSYKEIVILSRVISSEWHCNRLRVPHIAFKIIDLDIQAAHLASPSATQSPPPPAGGCTCTRWGASAALRASRVAIQ